MLIDCDVCVVRGPACRGCVVTVLLGAPAADRGDAGIGGYDLDGDEQAALAVLASTGLIPPLRLVANAASGSGTAPSGDDPAEPTGRMDGRMTG